MTNSILLQFKGGYLLVPIVIICAVFITFLDGKINKKSIDNTSYLKIALLSGIISIFCVYVNTLKGSVQEEILVGAAPF